MNEPEFDATMRSFTEQGEKAWAGVNPRDLRDTDRELIERLRSYARDLLLKEMEALSEECFCAGWMDGLEDSLWKAATSTQAYRYGMCEIPLEQCRKLHQLALDAGGWWVWERGTTFMPLEEWMKSLKPPQ